MEPIYVMLIVLNIHTGVEVSRSIESGPYQTPVECTQVPVGQPAEYPKGDTVVVHECSISHVDKAS
jgi:hypothetical protein